MVSALPGFNSWVGTFIAGVLYITQISDSTLPAGQLPKLDSAILLLSGLSNAAYLSLKVKENTDRRSTIEKEALIPMISWYKVNKTSVLTLVEAEKIINKPEELSNFWQEINNIDNN